MILRQALAVPLVATQGYAAPEVEQMYSRAYTLCQQVDDAHQTRHVLLGMWRVYNMRGALKTAREVAERLLDLAQRGNDPLHLIEAHRAVGVVRFWLGDLTAARLHLEQGAALYDHQQRASHDRHSGPDVGVSCLSMMSTLLWMLGYPDRAMAQSEQAITLAQKLTHPFSLAFALVNAARLDHFRREWRMLQTRAEAAQHLATEHHFAFWPDVVIMLISLALALAGWWYAYRCYVREPQLPQQWTAQWQEYYRVLLHAYYVDEVYQRGIVRPIYRYAVALWQGLDVGVIDRLVNGVAGLVCLGGEVVRHVQTGYVRTYALWVVIGALVIYWSLY